MPYDAARDLRGKHPRDTNNILVTTDGSMIFDGTGSQIINLSITASQAISASYEIIYETSSRMLTLQILPLIQHRLVIHLLHLVHHIQRHLRLQKHLTTM